MTLKADIRACTHCQTKGILPEARPIFQWPSNPRIGIFGQAPGNLAHQEGRPFCDPSGVRLRSWLGVSEAEFYESNVISIIPMAFCFPGYDGTGKTGKGGDRPPPKECADLWRAQIMKKLLPKLDLALLIGQYAQNWHMPDQRKKTLTARVEGWRDYIADRKDGEPIYLPMPHPSWRNNGWLKKNLWFEKDLLPWLQQQVQSHF